MKMQIRDLLPVLGLITLTAMPFTEAVSSELFGYVDLTRTGTFFGVNGGGVQIFSIGTQYDADENVTDQTSIVGSVLQATQNAQGDSSSGLIYAICTEYDEYLTTTSRYALYQGLDGAPSATGDITTNEARFIDQVLTAKFGGTLFDNSIVDYAANIRGLQALLWEAGTDKNSRAAVSANADQEDFLNKTIDMTANTGTGKATAEAWLKDDNFPGLDRVTTYVLIPDGQQQDFAFFLPQNLVPPSSSTPPLPVPGTLLLISLGLLGFRLGWRQG